MFSFKDFFIDSAVIDVFVWGTLTLCYTVFLFIIFKSKLKYIQYLFLLDIQSTIFLWLIYPNPTKWCILKLVAYLFLILQVALIHTDPVSERTPTKLNVCSIRNRALRERGAIVLKTAFRVTLIFSMSNLALNSYQNNAVLNIQFIDLKGFMKHLILMPRVETVLSNLLSRNQASVRDWVMQVAFGSVAKP